MRRIFAIMLVFTMAFTLAACSGSQGVSNEASSATNSSNETSTETPKATTPLETVKIGFINPMSSGQAAYGELQFKGSSLAIQEINAAGGVLGGHMLELSVFDDQSDSTQTVAGAQQFIADKSVVAVMGANNSGCTLAMVPLLKKANMLLANASSSAMGLMDYSNFFRTINDSVAQTAYSAKWSYELGKTAAVLVVNNDWGLDMAKGFTSAYTALGGKVLSTEKSDAGQNDFRSIITRIKTLNPEVVYIAVEGGQTAAFAQQAQELGFKCVFTGSTALNNEKVLIAAGNDLDGFYFVTEFYPYDPIERVSSFVKKYTAAYNNELPGQQSANAYEAIYLISNAIEKAGSLDRAAIIQGAYDMDAFQGVTGMIEFGGNNDHTLIAKEYTRMQIVDGKFVLAK